MHHTHIITHTHTQAHEHAHILTHHHRHTHTQKTHCIPHGVTSTIVLCFSSNRAKKVGKKPVGTDASLASPPDALVMENYT